MSTFRSTDPLSSTDEKYKKKREGEKRERERGKSAQKGKGSEGTLTSKLFTFGSAVEKGGDWGYRKNCECRPGHSLIVVPIRFLF